MHFSLSKYLDKKFPNLKIRKPLFYSWPTGLRFELGTENVYFNQKDFTYNENYFEGVLKRAIKIFEFLFHAEDDVLMIYQTSSYKRKRIRKSNYCFKQIKKLELSKITYQKIKGLYKDTYVYPKWLRASVKTKVNQIQYKSIFKAISNLDFGSRKPQVKGGIVFHQFK